MKRILSLALSVFLLFSFAILLPVSASETEEGLGVSNLYSVDFEELYGSLGLTEDTAAQDIENLGVTPLKYQFSAGAVGGGTYVTALTEGGLRLGSVHRCVTGFVLENTRFDLKGVKNYSIKIEMQESVKNTDYLYFGFGYTGSETTVEPMESKTNTRYNSSPVQVVFNNFTADSTTAAENLRTEINKQDNTVLYDFVVTNNICKKIIVICNGVTVTYTSETGINAAKGDFAMTIRNGVDKNNPTVLIKKISVERANVRMAGHQRSLVASDTFDLRFSCVIDDLSLYSKIGFDITVQVAGGETAEFTSGSNKVYKAISGTVDGTETVYTAKSLDGEYIYCATLIGIDTPEGEIVFTVRPYTVSRAGTRTEYTPLTVTYNGSAFIG